MTDEQYEGSTGEWLDNLGDEWEEAGVDPGNIFEFHDALSPDCLPGGLVETKGLPGVAPQSPLDVKRVVVRLRLRSEQIEMPGNRAIFVANFHRLQKELC